MLLVQIGLVNFPRVVILAEGIEDIEVLLFWQVVDDEVGPVLPLVPGVVQWSVQALRAGYNGHAGSGSEGGSYINTSDH